MSFVSSVYRGVQQVLVGVGDTTITAVDVKYTKLSLQGHQSYDTSGWPSPNALRITLANATTINATGQGVAYVTVEEFAALWLRQPIRYAMVTIPTATNVGYDDHGLSLGPKAYVVYLGHTGNRTNDGGILAPVENRMDPTIWLGGTQIGASTNQGPYATGGLVYVNYCLVDPR
jgi:hypothetical protein